MHAFFTIPAGSSAIPHQGRWRVWLADGRECREKAVNCAFDSNAIYLGMHHG
jgi:hypothetical protein